MEEDGAHVILCDWLGLIDAVCMYNNEWTTHTVQVVVGGTIYCFKASSE
jgi:hypothetical protein